MIIKEIISFLIGTIFVALGLISGATIFSAICFTNAILMGILLEISSQNTSKQK